MPGCISYGLRFISRVLRLTSRTPRYIFAFSKCYVLGDVYSSYGLCVQVEECVEGKMDVYGRQVGVCE